MKSSQSTDPTGRGIFLPDDDNQPAAALYVHPYPPQKKTYSLPWLSVWQVDTGVSLMEQARSKKLSLTDYRVRDWLLATINLGNWAIVSQAEMARQLTVDPAEVSKAISHLVDMGIVLKGKKIGRNSQYMINAAFCFKGSLAEGQNLARQAKKGYEETKVIQFPMPKMRQGDLLPVE